MPELTLPEWTDAPHEAGHEYEVEVDDAMLLVHFAHRTPYVRHNIDDFISAEAYAKKHLKPSVRIEFYKRLRYLLREWEV